MIKRKPKTNNRKHLTTAAPGSGFQILVYHILMSLGFVMISPFLPFVWLFSKKRRANLVQRLGFNIGIKKKRAGTRRIWVHALSVGEVRSSLPLVQALTGISGPDRDGRERQIVFTASTRTGYETACELFRDKTLSRAFQIAYFPFDLWFSIARVFRMIDPDLVCLVETDYWPGFLEFMKKRNIPVVLANARISLSSFKGYTRLGPFCPLFFSGFSHVMAQTRQDQDRFNLLGVPDNRISVVGNIKFDQPLPELDQAWKDEFRSRLGLADRVWIAGSTHEGEEALVLDAFKQAKKQIPGLKLILAPRDPQRCAGLFKQVSEKSELHPALFTSLWEKEMADISKDLILLDVMGILSSSYAVCDIAFIGGSLVSLGGHNPLEPAMFGKPILFGPQMADFFEIAGLLKTSGGAVEVKGSSDMAAIVARVLSDPQAVEEMGCAALKVFKDNSGAVDRTVKIMEKTADWLNLS